VTLFEQLRYYSWIVDRFHLSTRVWQSVHNGLELDFDWLEQRLRAIGFRIVLCFRDPRSFAAARSERLEVSGNPGQYDDLELFVDEQDRFDEAARFSSLPVMRLDVTDGDRERMCHEVADWLETEGGLYADY
jgi:thymidylate kinase